MKAFGETGGVRASVPGARVQDIEMFRREKERLAKICCILWSFALRLGRS